MAGPINLAVVQYRWRIEEFLEPQEWVTHLTACMEDVAARATPNLPTLVAFPEDLGLPLIAAGEYATLIGSATMQEALAREIRRHRFAVSAARLRFRLGWPEALWYARSKGAAQLYFSTFSRLAAQYHMYVLGGSFEGPRYPIVDGRIFLRPSDPHIYNTAYLFGPDGSILGAWPKCFLTPLEDREGLQLHAGDPSQLGVVDTEVGRIGVAVCLDAFQETILERLAALRADILVQPSANPAPWTPAQQEEWLEGSWRAVAGTGTFAYALNPMMCGSLFDLDFFGQSAIFSRAAITSEKGYRDIEARKGFLRVVPESDREGILVVTLPHP